MVRSRMRAALAVAALAVSSVAQVPTPLPRGRAVTPQQPEQREPPQVRDPLDPIWVRPPQPAPFEGFPVFPSQLSGYGNYPFAGLSGTGGAGQLPANTPLLPTAPPEPPGWPRWVRLRSKEPLPYAADLALLVRHADRVWWRQATDDAFVPLYHFDKFRAAKNGAEIQVRQAGEFELLLHSSSRLVAQGPTDLQLGELTETGVAITVRQFTRLRLQVTARDHAVRLPDGSLLSVDGVPGEAEPTGSVVVLLQRADEPSRYGGRATLFNAGARSVRWRDAFGERRLEPGHRLTMFLAPPASGIGAELVARGVQTTLEGPVLRCDGADGGELSWCGARIQVGRGRHVRLDPLQGEPFAADAGRSANGNRDSQ